VLGLEGIARIGLEALFFSQGPYAATDAAYLFTGHAHAAAEQPGQQQQ
jgi:hypothetical protein